MWSVTYLNGEREGEALPLAEHVAKRLAAMLAASPDASLAGRQAAAFLQELPSKGRTPNARLVLPSGVHAVWATSGFGPLVAHTKVYTTNVTRGERRSRYGPRGQSATGLPLRTEVGRKVWRSYVRSLNLA